MATEIKCPGCGHSFPMEEAMTEEYKKELREKMLVFTRQKDEEFQRKLEEFNQREQVKQVEFDKKLVEERNRIQRELENNLRKTISEDFENKLLLLESSNKDNEEKLKLARQKELEFLRKEQELEAKKAEMEIDLQRKLQEQRNDLVEQ
ncbi:MAG TPA: DUF2130 domain-containing protein, partial [Sphingobacteriaceae bacterium]